MLDALGAQDAIGTVMTSGDVEQAKPEPEIVDRALSDSGTDPGRAIMVGGACLRRRPARQDLSQRHRPAWLSPQKRIRTRTGPDRSRARTRQRPLPGRLQIREAERGVMAGRGGDRSLVSRICRSGWVGRAHGRSSLQEKYRRGHAGVSPGTGRPPGSGRIGGAAHGPATAPVRQRPEDQLASFDDRDRKRGRASASYQLGDLMPVDPVGDGLGRRPLQAQAGKLFHAPSVHAAGLPVDALVLRDSRWGIAHFLPRTVGSASAGAAGVSFSDLASCRPNYPNTRI
jgi:hypothetical protein